ncbi:MAG: NUDIX domain-containing protein [Candidatus Moranbacteria bacterium]|nr:NUDIX domain-containing protein [Candidatus Moranbacteria bacterium]
MTDELIDIYDENNVPLGITELKSEAHRDGLWHHTASIFVIDENGQILLQKRSKNMPSNGGKWNPSGAGYVEPGESERCAAKRELLEETGIDIPTDELGTPTVFSSRDTCPDGSIKAQFKYIYFVRRNVDLGELKLQRDEVDEVRFFHLKEFEEMISSDRGNLASVGRGFWELSCSKIKSMLNNTP